MLPITISGNEFWDEKKEELIRVADQTIQLEHSLVSVSKWESKWHKPFLHTKEKTNEEIIDYIKCMTVTPKVDPNVYRCLSSKNIKEINDYIDNPMTATTFSDDKSSKSNKEIVTAEIIYYWMISLNIPPEYRKWHLNKLITLIRVCNVKNSPSKKRSMRDIMNRNRALNEARKQKLNSKG